MAKDGKQRSNIQRGMTVLIVLKQDQSTGKLTRGIVRDILTRSAWHPHGIKVRLQSGLVGRVQSVVDLVSEAAPAQGGTESDHETS